MCFFPTRHTPYKVVCIGFTFLHAFGKTNLTPNFKLKTMQSLFLKCFYSFDMCSFLLRIENEKKKKFDMKNLVSDNF